VEIQQFNIIFQRLKSMGKSLRNKEAGPVFCRQDMRRPSPEAARALAQIKGHVQNGAAQTTDDFDFCRRCILKVHSADGALLGAVGVVDLGDLYVEASVSEFLIAKQT